MQHPGSRRPKRLVRIVACALLLCLAAPAAADSEAAPEEPDRLAWVAKVYDAVLVRPIGVASVAAGAGLFAIAYPLTAPFGDGETTRAIFLEEPIRFAFQRPLGDFGGR